ncbi:E3 ubiquitin-protein ligase hel1 [Maudiozyma exigua]|uniref:RBR-type E3 ubiquitin transferase n=1 Tax=Maudiozyma exigua TaxID=34358 RepID=A0A9P6WCN7_MAUEX|nr:E3 ubiquitin-protein ligase hel1 [Kazachstania exigua]
MTQMKSKTTPITSDYIDDPNYEKVHNPIFDSENISSFTLTEITDHKTDSGVLSQDSEFEIEDFAYSDDEFVYDDEENNETYDSMLSQPIKQITKKEMSEGSVPNLNYEVLTTQNIFKNMLSRLDHLQPVFNIPREDILLLMQHYDWNEERLLENWTERMDELLVEIGVSQKTSAVATSLEKKAENPDISGVKTKRGIAFKQSFECIICCEDKDTQTFSLECGHEYCIDCYRHYIENKLHNGNVITCMDCSLALKNIDIDTVMGHDSSKKLMASSIKSFIQKHNKNYKWCPYADCKCIIHLKDTSSLAEYTRLHFSPFVKCDAEHRFCFNCGFETHAPADCNVTNAWVKKAKKESENLNWVMSHTKECPKCGVNIEKDGGCNHMKCSSCKYEFCWICEGDWAPHGKSFYQCTLYTNDEKSKKKESEDLSKIMKKYTFYYRVFNEHEISAKLDWKLGQTIGSKVRALQEKMDVSWIEGQFLTDSIKILNEAVEDLSELLQIKDPEQIMKNKLEFYNKSGYVENRMYALMECGRDLLCKGICKPTD